MQLGHAHGGGRSNDTARISRRSDLDLAGRAGQRKGQGLNTQNPIQTVSRQLREWVAQQTVRLPSASEPPLRAELFSLEQLARHGKGLAALHQIAPRSGSHSLLARLDQNEQILKDYNRATYAADQTRRVTHAAEWLLDNFYLIEEQIQMARRHLPRGYSQELPRLRNGSSVGLPRVYDLALELIAHVDAQIDAESLRAIVEGYQTVCSLKLGELWAVAIMLRLALIENLRRVTARLLVARHDRDLADLWVDRLQAMAEKHPSHLVVVVADMARAELPLSSAFVAEFCQRLSRQNPVVHLARSWLEQRLAEQGLSIEQLVHLESQNQAADQMSISFETVRTYVRSIYEKLHVHSRTEATLKFLGR